MKQARNAERSDAPRPPKSTRKGSPIFNAGNCDVIYSPVSCQRDVPGSFLKAARLERARISRTLARMCSLRSDWFDCAGG